MEKFQWNWYRSDSTAIFTKLLWNIICRVSGSFVPSTEADARYPSLIIYEVRPKLVIYINFLIRTWAVMILWHWSSAKRGHFVSLLLDVVYWHCELCKFWGKTYFSIWRVHSSFKCVHSAWQSLKDAVGFFRQLCNKATSFPVYRLHLFAEKKKTCVCVCVIVASVVQITIKKILGNHSLESVFIPLATKLGGVYWIHLVCLSVR